jgi:peptide/nickel transport system substrate-binding protein
VLQIAHLGMGAPGEHFHVAPVHPEYAKLPFPERDVAKAKSLLAEAGYANGVDIEIACKPEPAWELLAVQAMVEQWKDAGIRTKINVMPASQYWDNWTKVPFGFTTWAHRPLGTMVLALGYRSGQAWNESKWSSPEFDKLITEAEGYLDVEKRRAVMAKIEALMQDEGPAVIPLWQATFSFVNKRVKGFNLHPSSYINAVEIALEA